LIESNDLKISDSEIEHEDKGKLRLGRKVFGEYDGRR